MTSEWGVPAINPWKMEELKAPTISSLMWDPEVTESN